jgi:hypothetical protein
MISRLSLVVSSYAPLFVLLAVRFRDPRLWISCLAAALVGLIALWYLLHRDRRASAPSFMLASVQSAGAEAVGYLGAYLLPFLTVSSPGVRDLIAYAGFFVIAVVVHLRTAIVPVNPLLYLVGWSVYSVESTPQGGQAFKGFLVARGRVLSGETIRASRFDDSVLIGRQGA